MSLSHRTFLRRHVMQLRGFKSEDRAANSEAGGSSPGARIVTPGRVPPDIEPPLTPAVIEATSDNWGGTVAGLGDKPVSETGIEYERCEPGMASNCGVRRHTGDVGRKSIVGSFCVG